MTHDTDPREITAAEWRTGLEYAHTRDGQPITTLAALAATDPAAVRWSTGVPAWASAGTTLVVRDTTPALVSSEPSHPEWCARPADEIERGIHLGQVLDANPAPDSLLGVAVQLYQHHPMPEHPGPFPTGVALLVTEDSETQWYPLPQGQAVALLHRLRWALRRAGAVK